MTSFPLYISGPPHLLLRPDHGAVPPRAPHLHRHDSGGVLGGGGAVAGRHLVHPSGLETHPARHLSTESLIHRLHLVSRTCITLQNFK